MYAKISQGLVDIPIGQFLKYNRNGVHFQTIYARTKYYEFSFFPHTVAAWNEFSSDTLLTQNLAMFRTLPPLIMLCPGLTNHCLALVLFFTVTNLLYLPLFSPFLTNNCFSFFSSFLHTAYKYLAKWNTSKT